MQHAVPEAAKHVPSQQAQLLAAQREAIAACSDYRDYLRQDLLPRSHGHFAVGRDVFEQLLRVEGCLDLSADDSLAIGRNAFANTKRQLEELAQQVNPRKSWPELVAEGRQDHP